MEKVHKLNNSEYKSSSESFSIYLEESDPQPATLFLKYSF
jgi:hypothetical protein